MTVQPASRDDSETTPLLPAPSRDTPPPRAHRWRPVYSILLCSFLVSMSFGVTQVPLIYVFRVMTCEAYWIQHPHAPRPFPDQCKVREIESATARAVSLLGISTTVFGTINLFVTRWNIKRLGVKNALALQVFTPVVRLVIQNFGVATGGAAGIIITQCSQIVTVLGGPSGYMLALNRFITDVTKHEERTGAIGQLQGCMMLGNAVGTLLGGVLADAYGIISPFKVALGLFVFCTIYVLLVLPRTPRSDEAPQASDGKRGFGAMLGPLRTLMPSRWRDQHGRVTTEYGAMLLALGACLAVLSTGYIPVLLQMYATDVFGFGTNRNSYLVATHAFLRGLFLTFVFPRIIKLGRHILDSKSMRVGLKPAVQASAEDIAPEAQIQVATAVLEDQEEIMAPKTDVQETYEFDLIYTRISLLIDGAITLTAAFITQGWEMYLLAVALPFGAGTGSASKGVILQMCPASARTDALSAIQLVEMAAAMSTTFVFGLVFAAFAAIGRPNLVFVCNAGVALVAVGVLMLSRFPPRGSTRIEQGQVEDRDD